MHDRFAGAERATSALIPAVFFDYIVIELFRGIRGFQSLAKGVVAEQPRDARQCLQVKARRFFGSDQDEEEMRRIAVERVARGRLHDQGLARWSADR